MTILWMLSAIAVGLVLVVAATALDAMAAHWRWPRRAIWALALAVAAALPFVPLVRPAPAPADARIARPAVATEPLATRWWREVPRRLEPVRLVLDGWGAPAVAGWLVVTGLLGLLYGATAHGLRRRRLRWHRRTIDTVPVLVADDGSGPAVVGVVRPQIVLPAWTLALGADRRAMILAHERAHLEARDPVLLSIAMLVAIALPWNVALWWIARRLRLAVEIDCDRRVLRAMPAPNALAYGRLLVDVGARASLTGLGVAPALLERRTSLERRITAMRTTRPRHAIVRSAMLAAVAIAAIIVACEAPKPDPTAPAVSAALSSSPRAARSPTAAQSATGPITEARARALVSEHFSARDLGTDEPLTALLVQDASGKVVRSLYTTGPLRGAAPADGRAGHAIETRKPSNERVVLRALPPTATATTGRIRVGTMERRGSPLDQSVLQGIATDAIASVEVVKYGPGRVATNPVGVITVRLKPGIAVPEAGVRREQR